MFGLRPVIADVAQHAFVQAEPANTGGIAKAERGRYISAIAEGQSPGHLIAFAGHFARQGIDDGVGKVWITAQGVGQFFQGVQRTWRAADQRGNQRLNESRVGQLLTVAVQRRRRRFRGAGQHRAVERRFPLQQVIDVRFGVSVLDPVIGQCLGVAALDHHAAFVDQHLGVTAGLARRRQHFNDAVVHVLPGRQYHARVDFERDVGGAADDEVNAHHLGLAGALGQLRFKAGRTVGHRHQIAVRVVQADFTNPPAADVFRDHLLGNDHVGVFRVDLDLIQRRAAALVDQLGLRPVGLRVGTVSIAHAHLRERPRDVHRVGVGLLGLAHGREDRHELAALINHEYTSRYSV